MNFTPTRVNGTQTPLSREAELAHEDIVDNDAGIIYWNQLISDVNLENVQALFDDATRAFLIRADPDADIDDEGNADVVEEDAKLQAEIANYFEIVKPSDPYFPYKSKTHAWIHMITSLPRQVRFWMRSAINYASNCQISNCK
jgi:hypothetical protein